MSVHAAPVTLSTIVVAVDVGKTSAVLSVTGSARQRVFGSVEFAMTRSDLVKVETRAAGQECTGHLEARTRQRDNNLRG